MGKQNAAAAKPRHNDGVVGGLRGSFAAIKRSRAWHGAGHAGAYCS